MSSRIPGALTGSFELWRWILFYLFLAVPWFHLAELQDQTSCVLAFKCDEALDAARLIPEVNGDLVNVGTLHDGRIQWPARHCHLHVLSARSR